MSRVTYQADGTPVVGLNGRKDPPTSTTDPSNDRAGDTHVNPRAAAGAPGGERIADKPQAANNPDTAATGGSTTETSTTPTTHGGQNRAGAKP